MKVKIKKLNENAVIPTYGTEYSAGADLCALLDEPKVIEPHKTEILNTGIALEIPEGYCGLIFARSGLASKRGLAPANKVGVIDADYRGEVMVLLINLSDKDFVVNDGERIAQMVIARHEQVEWEAVEMLSETERGAGGFGHTGV